MDMAKPIRSDDTATEITVDSVDSEALRLLETNPSEYFRQTHRRLPFGFSSRQMPTQAD